MAAKIWLIFRKIIILKLSVMLKDPQIKTISLKDLNEEDISSLYGLFEENNHPERADGAFLIDRINYRELARQSRGHNSNTGRVFFASLKKKVVGFLLVIDDVDLRTELFPLNLFATHLPHDFPFLEDLVHLKSFAFVVQIGVSPEAWGLGIGHELINSGIQFYKNKKTVLLATTIYERQFHIHSILRKHPTLFLFLDQQVSPRDPNQMRFRVVSILKQASLYRRINPETLSKTFNTMIPIQLNLACISVNLLLEKVGAKILWTSFFQTNELLTDHFQMDKNYNGYYNPLLGADEKEFPGLVAVLKKINHYLIEKDAPNADVPSLTPIMKNSGFQFFFTNAPLAEKDFLSFAKPWVFHIEKDIYSLCSSLMQRLLKTQTTGFKMNGDQQKMLWDDLGAYLKERKEGGNDLTDKSATKKWNEWVDLLFLSKEDECLLVDNIEGTLSRDSLKKGKVRKILSRNFFDTTKRKQWVEWVNLHREMYLSDLSVLDNPENYYWCHGVVPITFSGGLSGVMFSFVCTKKKGEEMLEPQIIDHLSYTISSALSKNMFNIIIKLQHRAIENTSHRYAVAALSARNVSHNIGSQVLSYLGQENALEIVMARKGKFPEERGAYQLATFFTYLKTRMSLLADMSTTEPVATIASYLNAEIIEPFKKQQLIQEFITHPDYQKIDIDFKYESDETVDDILVQIPNAELGYSAFYMILVNFIRNSIKHNPKNESQVLRISVRARDHMRGYIITFHDNIPLSLNNQGKLAEEINQYYIKSRFLNKDYTIRDYGWGIAEIISAATYLRKKMPSFQSGLMAQLSVPLLKAVEIPSEEKDQTFLGFEIYLKKPREMLIIDSSSEPLVGQNFKDCRNRGIKIMSIRELEKKNKDIHSHYIGLSLDDSFAKSTLMEKKKFPLRWVFLNQGNDIAAIRNLARHDLNGLLVTVWQKWTQQFKCEKGLAGKTTHVFKYTSIMDKPKLLECLSKYAPGEVLLFDSHGESIKDKIVKDPGAFFFYESYHSYTPTGIVLNNQDALPPEDPRWLKMEEELLEAALTDVVVLDERIQQECSNRKKPPFDHLPGDSFFEYLKWMRIHVPNPKEEGSPDLLCSEPEYQMELRVISWLDKLIYSRKIDFIVMHIGFLERMIGSTRMEVILAWIEKNIRSKDSRPEIIFTSGRGKPNNLPLEISFQPYNNISPNITGFPAKYHLCHMLFSSRTRNR